LESPDILQAGKKFVIQNQTYCTGRDLELQYINTAQEIMRHTKYLSIFNSTLCTLSKVDKETEDRLVHVGQGDSGGPLVVYQNVTDGIELPILVGVVSYGIADDDDSISCSKKDSVNNTIEYFSSVPFYREWIDLTVSSYDNPHEQSGVFSL
jgi:secreted trypsin-like serine protease